MAKKKRTGPSPTDPVLPKAEIGEDAQMFPINEPREIKTLGILTGGGDSPAINSTVRSIVMEATARNWRVRGILEGWRGVLENNTRDLTRRDVVDTIHTGGTFLFTSRTNPRKREGGIPHVADMLRSKLCCDALIAVGGDDTLGVCNELCQAGYPAVGIPQTIDNDLSRTEYSIGFDTSVGIVGEAIDRLHTTARSHQRVMVVEVMGRDAGWIATIAGLAAGAHQVLIPEYPFDLEEVYRKVRERYAAGKHHCLIVIAEGAKPSGDLQSFQDDRTDEFGHGMLGGVGRILREFIEEKTGYESRDMSLGHLQRGGTPTVMDRVWAARFGSYAVEMVADRRWGRMVSTIGTEIVDVPLTHALGEPKPVPPELYELANKFNFD